MGRTKSLFGQEYLESPEAALEHDSQKHGVDLVGLVAAQGLDFHQIIRLINYIRWTQPTPEQVNATIASSPYLYDDGFMAPVLPDDPLLQLDIEELALERQPSSSTSASQHVNAASLQQQIDVLSSELESSRSALISQKTAMERFYREKFGGGASSEPKDGGEDAFKANLAKELKGKDKVRTESYRTFILSNPAIFKDAVVLDVGCGTGILSMFAAQAGAKKVYAVDASSVLYKAERNVKENGLEGVIECINGKIEDLEGRIPKNGVDVIISEWMGYFLLYEAMLDSVLVAREKYLRLGGLMVPNQCSILLAAVQDDALIADKVDFWDDIYGFKMSAMKENIHKDGEVLVLKPDTLISTVVGIKDVDMSKDTPKDSDFSSPFSLRATRSGKVHGFLGWFDTFFTGRSAMVPSLTLQDPASSIQAPEVAFTTGPHGTPTHWKQTFFQLDGFLEMQEGDLLEGTFNCRKGNDYTRELEVEMNFRKKGDKQDRMQVWTVR